MGQHARAHDDKIERDVIDPRQYPYATLYEVGDIVTIDGPNGQKMLNFRVFKHGPHMAVMPALSSHVVILDALPEGWQVTNIIRPRLAKMTPEDRLREMQAALRARSADRREKSRESQEKGNTHQAAALRGEARAFNEVVTWVDSYLQKRYRYRKHLR